MKQQRFFNQTAQSTCTKMHINSMQNLCECLCGIPIPDDFSHQYVYVLFLNANEMRQEGNKPNLQQTSSVISCCATIFEIPHK